MVEWVKVGMDVGVGAIAGVGDQLIQNADDKRAEDLPVGEKLAIIKQFGTYYNYGVPVAAILGTAFGWFKGDMATRLVTAGAQLAGRKATHQITKKTEPASWSSWRRNPEAEARARAGAEEAARRAAHSGGSRLEF